MDAGKDHPFAPAQRSDILLECRCSFEHAEIGEELKLAGNECRVEILQKQPPEQVPARNPALAVDGYSTARHDAVNMGMMIKVLTPCMEYGGQPNPGSQMSGIGGDSGKRLGGGLEQNAVHLGLVL